MNSCAPWRSRVFRLADPLGWRDKVAQIEACSGAEVVVAVQPQAGSYADVPWKCALLGGFLTLVFMVHSPILFHPDGLWMNVALAGLLSGLLGSRWQPVRVWLTSKARRRSQFEDSLLLAFELLQLSHTRQRTGLLLLVSWLECRACLKPDLGLTARLAGAELNRLQQLLDGARDRHELAAAVSTVLERLQPLLAEAVPREGDDVNELSDEVRQL